MYQVQYDEQLHVVTGKYTGGLDVSQLTAYSKQVSELASKHQCSHFLSDLRDFTLKEPKLGWEFSSSNLAFTADRLADSGFKPKFKRAIITHSNVKALKIWVNCCFKLGYKNVALFVDEEAALAWLKEEESIFLA